MSKTGPLLEKILARANGLLCQKNTENAAGWRSSSIFTDPVLHYYVWISCKYALDDMKINNHPFLMIGREQLLRPSSAPGYVVGLYVFFMPLIKIVSALYYSSKYVIAKTGRRRQVGRLIQSPNIIATIFDFSQFMSVVH